MLGNFLATSDYAIAMGCTPAAIGQLLLFCTASDPMMGYVEKHLQAIPKRKTRLPIYNHQFSGASN